MAEKRSLREQGPLSYIQDAATPDDILGRPEDQARATQGQLLDPQADFERGLQQAAISMEAGQLHRAADFAKRDGDLEGEERFRRHALRLDQQAQEFAPRVSSTADVQGFGDAIDYAQGALGQATPSIAGTTIPGIAGTVGGGIAGFAVAGPAGVIPGATIGGGLAGGIPGFKMEAGEAAASQYGDEYIRNLPVDERIREQNIKGGLGMAAELALPGLVGGRLLKSLGKVFGAVYEGGAAAAKAATKTALRDRAKSFGLETFTEGATEGTQAVIGQQSLARLNPNRDATHDVQEIIDSVVMGALAGGGLSLGTNVPGALTDAAKGKINLPKFPDIGGQGTPPGTRVPDAGMDAAAEGTQGELFGTPRQSEAEQDAIARGEDPADLDPYGPEFYGPEGPFPAGDGTGSAVTPEDVDVDEAGRARADAELEREVGGPISEAEMDRRARVRKSAFGTRIPVEQTAQESEQLRKARPEEVMQLRELRPMSGKQERGERRYVRRTPEDTKAFLDNQVKRGVISQEVADSAVVEPLGQSMKRQGATTQELENEVAVIVRDLMRRIEGHKKSKEDRTDIIKALTSELENLPIDVQRRGETTERGASRIERKFDREIERDKQRAGTRKMKKDAKQGDLFPTEESFPVPISEFRRNHFGFKVDLDQNFIQRELDLNQDMTRDELLIRALDQYSSVLTSNAAQNESAASAADTKDARSRTDVAATAAQRAKLTPIKLKKKNGQTETLDADSLAAVGIRQEGGREALIGGRKNVSGQREQEAAIAAGLAAQLLRNDVDGIVDPKTGKVVRGVEANKAIQRWIKSLPKEQRGRATRGMKNKERRALGQYELKSSEMDLVESGNRGKIQRGFKHMLDRIRDDQKLNELAGGKADEAVTPKKARELRKDLRKKLTAEAQRIRGLIQQTNDFIAESREKKIDMDDDAFDAWYKAAKDNLDPQIIAFLDSKAKKGTAKFRADRLESLVKEIDEIALQEKMDKEVGDLQGELEGGRAETLEPTGVRHAEEQTGAGTQVKVGTPLRGEKPSKTLSTAAQKLAKKNRRLQAQLKKVTNAAEARALLERSLGYKEGELKLTSQEQHVLLGSTAKQYVRDALQEAGVPTRTAASVQPGERVVVLVAKQDMEQVINSKEFRTLMNKGATIFMPISSNKFSQEFLRSGYKPMGQPGTTVMWVPTVGFSDPETWGGPTSQVSTMSQMTGLSPEMMDMHLRASIWENVGKAIGKTAANVSKKKVAQWVQNQLAEGGSFEQIQQKVADYIEKATPAAQKFWKEVQAFLNEQADNWQKAQEKAKQKQEEKAKQKAFEKTPEGLRAKIKAQWPPSKFEAMLGPVGGGLFGFGLISEEQKAENKAWVAENYDLLLDILTRREMLRKTPAHALDKKWANDPKAQAAYLKEVFGDAASRIALVENPEAEKLTEYFDIKLEGQSINPAELSPAGKAVYGFLLKMAPATGSTIRTRAYFDNLRTRAQELINAINDEGEYALLVYDYNNIVENEIGVMKPALLSIGNKTSGGGKPNWSTEKVAKLKTIYWGKEHVNTPIEELMDVPFINIAPEENILMSAQRAEQRMIVASRKVDTKVHRGEFALGKGMTLRMALEGSLWLDKHADNIDIGFTGDLERLTMDHDISEAGGAMGMFNPIDDRVFLMPGARANKFMTGWTAWHEMYHRGMAVKYGDQVTTVLEKAAKNPVINKVAKAIQAERKLLKDATGSLWLGAVEEALVEFAAAREMNDIDHFEAQYGVKVSEELLTPLDKLVEMLKDVMRLVMSQFIDAAEVDSFRSSVDVLEILRDARKAAIEAPTSRGQTVRVLETRGFDTGQLRFSRDAELNAALSQTDRKAREQSVTDYLAKVLGDRIKVIFKDINQDGDPAGVFDWKKATIQLAMNNVHWKGVTRHEAFHAWFQALGKMDGNRKLYTRLLKAASAPHIKKQLRTLLAGNPEALEQLKSAEERLAYMFQFYASGQLKVQPDNFKLFRKWAKGLAKLVGYTSRLDAAEAIFQSFDAGNLKTNDQISAAIREQSHKKLWAEIDGVLRPMRQAAVATMTTATDRLRSTNNQALTRIADLYAKGVKGGGLVGYIAMKGQKESQFRNLFNDALDKHVKGKENQDQLVQDALKELQDQKPTSELSPLAKDIRIVLRQMYKYLRDQQNDTRDADGNIVPSPNAVRQLVYEINEDGKKVKKWIPIADNGETYFPRVWDPRTIADNWAEFKSLMKQEGRMTDEALDNFKAAIERGDGMVEIDNNYPTFDAAMRAVNSRMFDFITPENAHLFSKFQEQDLTKILTTYARQAAHRGEQTRHFGYDNQKIKTLLEEAKDEGATEEELKIARNSIKALDGTLGIEAMTPLRKNAMMTAMTVVNFAVLPLALFSSLVDPLGVAVRTGDFKAAGKTFTAGAKQIVADLKGDKTKHQKLAEFLGIVEQEQVLSIIGDSYNSMFANEQIQKMNTRFFKVIGLDSWTKGTRIGAMVASMEYIKEYKNDTKRMAELGLEPGDIRVRQDGQIELAPSVLGQEKARRVQGAIYRMVDEAILRPTAAQRPVFMSDMRFMLLGHLKQFTFSFHNTILKQVAANVSGNIDEGQYYKAMTQFAPLIMYVPFMMAADVLRSIVGGRIDDEDDKDVWDYLGDGLQRSAVLGIGTFGLDAVDDMSYGNAPVNTFLGPVIHKGARLVEAGIDPDEQFLRQATRMLPGYAFWKGWME